MSGPTIVMGPVVPAGARPLARGVAVDPVVDVRSRVAETQTAHVGRRVFEHDFNFEHDLLAGGNVDPAREIFDDYVGCGTNVRGRPRPRTRDLHDVQEAQICGRCSEIVLDADIEDVERIRRLRDGDSVAEALADRRRCLGVRLQQRVDRKQRDHDLRRIFVTRHIGIGLPVDVGIVTVGELDGVEQVCLVEDDRAVSEGRVQGDVELDQRVRC